VDVDFIVDDQLGPEVTVQFPQPGTVVSGLLTVRARAVDPEGVVGSAVVGTIAGREFPMVETSPGIFEGTYDTNRLGLAMVFPTIIVRAQDVFGNQGAHGLVVTLDNRGPLADLDPPENFREALAVGGTPLCSEPFDPVGVESMDDGAIDVAQLSRYAARVEDLGNGSGLTAEPGIYFARAGVDVTDVQVYVLDDTTRPIVVDTNGDGFCDELNPHLVPTTIPSADDEMARIDLVGLIPRGMATYLNDDPFPICGAVDYPPAGELLCLATTSDLNRIIAAPDEVTPAIFAIPPATDIQCMGNAFDSVGTNIGDGWTCLAVRAVDVVGNVGVSAPLRVCIDYDASGGDCTGPMPDCTGTYDPVTDTVDPATPCVLEFAFPENELRQLSH